MWQQMPMVRGVSQSGNSAQPVAFYMIPGHIYQLVEYGAPAGFTLPMGQWRIVVDETDPWGFRVETIGGISMSRFVYVPDAPTPGEVRWFVGNSPQMELPLSGGSGISASLAVAGTVLVGAAVTLLFVKFKQPTRRWRT